MEGKLETKRTPKNTLAMVSFLCPLIFRSSGFWFTTKSQKVGKNVKMIKSQKFSGPIGKSA
jgi:hypothetical protein